MGIHFVLPEYVFDSQMAVAIDFHFMNHQRSQFQLKIFTFLLKKKKSTAWPMGEKINSKLSFFVCVN